MAMLIHSSKCFAHINSLNTHITVTMKVLNYGYLQVRTAQHTSFIAFFLFTAP